uniref:Uncharacterized protein n=2 Tax=Avena sativa TaxID=4498 RepID=A0ACD5XTX2_AVESA
MGLLELFITACMPVLKMLLVTGVGSFLATDFAGILGKEARKHLNYVVFYVFNTCLVSVYLAKTITMESMAKLWFMPVNVFFTFIFGLIFGWIVIKVTGAPPKLRGLILGCCSAGNLGTILLIIIPALCKEKGSPFGEPDACETYGLAYASLSKAIGSVFLWTCTYNIIRANSEVIKVDGDTPASQTKVSVSDSTTDAVSGENFSISSDHVDECALPLIYSPTTDRTKVSFLERAKTFLSSVSRSVDLKKLFAPSTISVIIGFIIGGTPLLRNAVIGESAPLRFLSESAELIGGGAVPSVTLIMGGNLITGLRGDVSVPRSVIAGIVAVRYILLPLLGTVLVKAAIRFAIIRPDPLYQFILLLQYAVPPAMNLGTITQLFGMGQSECSVIFVWVYPLASVAVAVWSAFFMWTLL